MSLDNINRIVIFTGVYNYSTVKCIFDLRSRFTDVEFLIIKHNPSKSLKKRLMNQIKLFKKHGIRLVLFRAIQVKEIIKALLNNSKCMHPNKLRSYSKKELLLCTNNHEFCDINDYEAVKVVKEYSPDLGISIAAPILKKDIFSIPTFGTINIHKGKLPNYRGMPPAFWELWNGEKEVGCTIHYVNSGLDKGDVIIEKTLKVQKYSTVKGMRLRLDEFGSGLLLKAVDLIISGKAKPAMQEGIGKTYSKPSLMQENKLNNDLRYKSEPLGIKSIVKNIIFFAYVNLITPIPRVMRGLFAKQRVIVLMYHRVNDELRDKVTVGIEQFDSQMQWIADNHCVVPLEDVINNNVNRSSLKTIIAVTFDDGYKDNYENAVPILLRHGVPATFFVSTGNIEEDKPFKHDIDKLGRGLPNMSWNNLKSMIEIGFQIGSHTVNHINCAKVDRKTLRDELLLSKKHIEKNLGIDNVVFAYPFGGREHINEDALNEIKQAGYASCLSAYGGFVGKEFDKFNILRVGINSGFNMYSFRARLEGFN